MTLDKSKYDNSWYKPGSLLKRTLWYFCSAIFFQSRLLPFSALKVYLLKLFGAKVGKRCYIKPGVNIKYPWFLEIGNNVGIGEDAWIDNVSKVIIGNNVTISQRAHIITGSHNYKSRSFGLILTEVVLKEGSWICSNAMIGPNVTVHEYAILTMGAVATKDLKAYGIYSGNPASYMKERVFDQA